MRSCRLFRLVGVAAEGGKWRWKRWVGWGLARQLSRERKEDENETRRDEVGLAKACKSSRGCLGDEMRERQRERYVLDELVWW